MFTYFASEAAEGAAGGGLLGTLGIDVRLFLEQLVAFLILVLILRKWVFPPIIRAVDKRQESLEAATREAAEARKALEQAEEKADEILAVAKKQAGEIVGTARAEAADVVQKSEEKSRVQAERIVAEARESIDKEILQAKKTLHNEMIDLVAAATEKVTSKAVTENVDRQLMTDALKEGK